MPPSVLIAEDDSDLRTLWAIAFERAGFEVQTVQNGSEAIQQICEAPLPDTLVVDYMMPFANGLEVLKTLAKVDGHKKVLRIMVTSSAEVEAEVEAYTDFFLVKPVLFHDIISLAKRIGE